MLADEELVVAEFVGTLNQRDVAVEGQRRIFRRMVQRHHEDREFQNHPSALYFYDGTFLPGEGVNLDAWKV